MEALATITSVKGLVVALQSIRTNHKLPCAVTFDPSSGLKLRFLDGGHAMQSGISLSTSVSWPGGGGCARRQCEGSGSALAYLGL